MTTFHDPLPQSRRAVRQSERGEHPDTTVEFEQFVAQNLEGQPQVIAAGTGRRARIASENAADVTPPELVEPPAQPSAYSRRRPAAEQFNAEPRAAEPLAAEPLSYYTQGRPALSAYDEPSYQRAHVTPVEPTEQASTASAETGHPAAETGDAEIGDDARTAFRVRDYSPESRRRAPQSADVPQTDLDYQTQAGFVPGYSAPVPDAPIHAAPLQVAPTYAAPLQAAPIYATPTELAAAAPTPAQQTPHPTLTRRELRAMRTEAEGPAVIDDQPAAAAVQATSVQAESFVVDSIPHEADAAPQEASASTLSSVMAEFDALRAAQSTPPAQASQPFPPIHTSRSVVPAPFAGAEQQAPAAASNVVPFDLDVAFSSLLTGEPVQPAPPVVQVADPQFVEPENVTDSRPIGHWSRQADQEDDSLPYENTISRNVGGGNVATATSALVLSEIPAPANFGTALDSTGDILVTGTIDLPRSLGATGGDARQYDDPGVDYLFDALDQEIVGTDSVPVRAIRAVSTHTSTRGVIHTTKPHGNRMLTALLIAASSMAVGVVVLLVAGMVFKAF